MGFVQHLFTICIITAMIVNALNNAIRHNNIPQNNGNQNIFFVITYINTYLYIYFSYRFKFSPLIFLAFEFYINRLIKMKNLVHNTCMIMRVPITIFDRHIHLSELDSEKLFWKWYKFNIKKNCIQPWKFIAKETLTIKWKYWEIKNIDIILPFRKITQVEVFKSDGNILWQNIPERFSNDLEWSSEWTLMWPKWSVYLNKWLIVAKPHIHLSVAQSEDFWFKNNQIVSVKTHWTKIYTFENVKIRGKDYFEFDFHINREQAEQAWIQNWDWGEIIYF